MTIGEARAEIQTLRKTKGYGDNIKFVITENKLNEKAKIKIGFRCMVNEEFVTDWKQYSDGSYYRMVEMA